MTEVFVGSLSTTIASTALAHFEGLPKKAKPKDTEWTVFAAIIASHAGKLWVVSSATGTKSTASDHDGTVLNDCHAEVLCRRGLIRVLLNDMVQLSNADPLKHSNSWGNLIEGTEHGKCFKLRDNLDLHLYISDSPCGDASIYENDDPNQQSGIQYTGSKAIDSNIDANLHSVPWVREKIQKVGCVRTKSGRSDISEERRSTSMSCSDKIARWNFLGLQGALLSSLVEEPIRLKSVVVSRDPSTESSLYQKNALSRALIERLPSPLKELKIDIEVVEHQFRQGKSCNIFHGRKRKRDEPKTSPAGVAMNWNQIDSTVELIASARGLKQGKKPKDEKDYANMKSRLSRRSLLEEIQKIVEPENGKSYSLFKNSLQTPSYKELRSTFLSNSTFKQWIVEEREFMVQSVRKAES